MEKFGLVFLILGLIIKNWGPWAHREQKYKILPETNNFILFNSKLIILWDVLD